MSDVDIQKMFNRESTFKIDERDIYFQLFDVLKVSEKILSTDAYKHVGEEECVQMIELAIKFAKEYLGKSYQVADKEGCTRLSSQNVKAPEIYKHVWNKFQELGLCGISAPLEYGGCGTPYVVNQAIYSILYGADPAFCIYPGFNVGAVYLLEKYGSEIQKRNFSQALTSPTMTAALVMTEADAGSDIGIARTRAIRESSGEYRIEGSKIFISSGMHDLCDNIVYFVIARVEGGPAGTQGLSCFIVPKFRINEDGTRGEFNNITCDAVEHKMGLKGNATVQLSFGRDEPCYGTLLGEQENKGLSQVIMLMNLARVATGTYALGLASSAYYSAVNYANNRIQGTSIRAMGASSAPRLPIIQHLDVQRMLLDMKAKVEGMRSLVLKAANYSSLASTHIGADDSDVALRKKYGSIADLLTPVVKAYCSDQAWRVCETSIQVHGGYGYISDFPVEQNARDVKIMSIWEGTNYMQASDLIRAKLGMGKKSAQFNYLKEDIRVFLEQKKHNPLFGGEFTQLENALSQIENALTVFGEWLTNGEMEQIYLMSTRFLDAFGDFMLGWLLLENAIVAADEKQKKSEKYDSEFYQGKINAAKYFFKNTLAHIESKLGALAEYEIYFKEITPAQFAQIG